MTNVTRWSFKRSGVLKRLGPAGIKLFRSPRAGATGATGSTGVVCFASGTRILTGRGAIAVEALRVGDLAVTASGNRRPIT